MMVRRKSVVSLYWDPDMQMLSLSMDAFLYRARNQEGAASRALSLDCRPGQLQFLYAENECEMSEVGR